VFCGDVCLLFIISEGQNLSPLQSVLPSADGHYQFVFTTGKGVLFYNRDQSESVSAA